MLSIQHKHHLLKREEVLVALYHIHTKKSDLTQLTEKGFTLKAVRGDVEELLFLKKNVL